MSIVVSDMCRNTVSHEVSTVVTGIYRYPIAHTYFLIDRGGRTELKEQVVIKCLQFSNTVSFIYLVLILFILQMEASQGTHAQISPDEPPT